MRAPTARPRDGVVREPHRLVELDRGDPARDRGRLDAAVSHIIRRSPTLVCRAIGTLLYRYAA
jgi:hypothetical protein